MKIISRVVISVVLILLSTSAIYAQDLSRYRNFSFGMKLADISKQVAPQLVQTKLVHKYPAVIEEATWWPRESSTPSPKGEPVWQVLFTFYNGELYRILVTYDQQAVKGLTIEDMVEAVSVDYGTATRPDALISFPTNELYNSTERVIARWEDSRSSVNLFRSSFLNSFGVVMFSKRQDAQVRAALAEALQVEGREDRQGEIERQMRDAELLEAARQKNRKTFRP